MKNDKKPNKKNEENDKKPNIEKEEEFIKIRKNDVLNAVKEMRASIENLPPHAMFAPTTFSDHYSLLLLLEAVLQAE